ncbi:hypothetical protein SESBI_07945 [Sesbania bispinosa]|nr:hypothetical protein SESBI_07945 [Sesbania bispinosa]
MRSISTSKLNTTTTTTTIASHSPWHSPIPYLFGGLAAIMGLIAFALLVLACSYWGLSRNQDGTHNENKEGDTDKNEEPVKVLEEKILVIMAGDDKPTFLATPKSHIEIHNHVVLIPDAAAATHTTTSPQENESSQHTQ